MTSRLISLKSFDPMVITSTIHGAAKPAHSNTPITTRAQVLRVGCATNKGHKMNETTPRLNAGENTFGCPMKLRITRPTYSYTRVCPCDRNKNGSTKAGAGNDAMTAAHAN